MNNEQIIILKTILRTYFTEKCYAKSLTALDEVLTYKGNRKDGVTPIYVHMLCVADFLRSFDVSDDLFAIALLHDSTEDKFSTSNQILKTYDLDISRCVQNLDKTGKTEQEYYYNISDCPRCSVVKGSDRIHNLQTIVGVFSIEKQKSYIEETKRNVLPMLQKASSRFPGLTPIYLCINRILNSQIELIEHLHKAISPS